ncbi:MAG: MATE family efflux transporter [Neisseriaceae bacterium]|nr:MATE family efflux transporter [Neisseriaceae bacterium]
MNLPFLAIDRGTRLAISKRLIRLMVPITLTFVFIILSDTIDTVFSSQYDATTLAAISVATLIGILPLATANGIAYTAVPLYSYLKQQNKPDEIFNLIVEFLIIGMTIGIVFSVLFIIGVPYALKLIGVAPAIIPLVETYLTYLLPYILGMIAFNNFYYFSESYGFPVFATVTVLLSFCIKGLFIYLLVFSDFVQHSWGIAGFGLASVIFAWSKFLILLPIILMYQNFRVIWHHPLQRLNLSPQRMWQNTKKGIPISLSYLSEWGAIMVMGLMLARLGVNEVGANGIVYSIMPFSLVIVTALSRSIAILVAQHQDEHTLLKQTLTVGIMLALGLLALICLALILFSTLIMGLYKPSAELLQLARSIYPYMIWVLFCLGLNNIFCFALKGLSDFFIVFVILFMTSWLIFIPLGYLLSSTPYLIEPQGIRGWWYALSLSTFISACLSGVRLRYLIKQRQPMPS